MEKWIETRYGKFGIEIIRPKKDMVSQGNRVTFGFGVILMCERESAVKSNTGTESKPDKGDQKR